MTEALRLLFINTPVETSATPLVVSRTCTIQVI
jgi:hypothetical protein